MNKDTGSQAKQSAMQDERISGIENTLDRLMDYITWVHLRIHLLTGLIEVAGGLLKIRPLPLYLRVTKTESQSYCPKTVLLCQSVLCLYRSIICLLMSGQARRSYRQQIYI